MAHRDNYGARLRIRKRVHSARSGDAYVKLRIRNDASATDYAVRRRHATLICANARQAAQLLGAAEALREMTGGRNPDERYVTDRVATTLRAQLDPELLEKNWAAGRAMSLEQTIAEALEYRGSRRRR